MTNTPEFIRLPIAEKECGQSNQTLPGIKTPAMSWSIRAIPGSPKDSLRAQLILASSTLAVYTCYAAMLWEVLLEDPSFIVVIIFSCLGLGSYLVAAIRQKTRYKYRVYRTRARLAYQIDYSKPVKYAFKTTAFLIMFFMILAGLMTGSVLFIIGPVFSYCMAALYLLNVQNPVKRDTSLLWHEYNFVTIDRKYRTIVTHKTDPTLGFEARLPNDELFEQYLEFLRTVLPAHVEYTEKRWDWSHI